MIGRPLDEDRALTVIIESCVIDIRQTFETSTKYMSHKEVHDHVGAYIEKRRDSSASGPNPLGIGMQEEDEPDRSGPEFQL